MIDGKRFYAGRTASAGNAAGCVFHLGDEAVFADLPSLEQHLQQQPGWQPQRPRLALLTSVPGPFNANRDHVDTTIRAFESRGFEVIPMAAVRQRLAFYSRSSPTPWSTCPMGG